MWKLIISIIQCYPVIQPHDSPLDINNNMKIYQYITSPHSALILQEKTEG